MGRSMTRKSKAWIERTNCRLLTRLKTYGGFGLHTAGPFGLIE